MTLTVQKNPAHAVDGKLTVLHPDTGRPFADGAFVMTDADANNPRVRRLFADHRTPLPTGFRGLPGGVFGDLLVVEETTPAVTAKK